MDDDLQNSFINAKRIAWLLDSEFSIGRVRFGIDSILGLIPIIGDSITAFLSLYIVFTAFKFEIPMLVFIQMLINVLLDYLLGSIPLIGDLFDIVYKANLRNIKILEKYAQLKI